MGLHEGRWLGLWCPQHQFFGNRREGFASILLDVPGVAQPGNLWVNGQPSQESHPNLPGRLLCVAGTKDLVALAGIGTFEVAHVLDQPQDRRLHLLGHARCLAYYHSC